MWGEVDLHATLAIIFDASERFWIETSQTIGWFKMKQEIN